MMVEQPVGLKCWHKVKLSTGEYTKGWVDVALYKDFLFLNEVDHVNRKVLDIGCWDGYYAFEAERAGAIDVVALDNPKYRWGGLATFDLLKMDYGSQHVRFVLGGIYDIPKLFPARYFDIVYCFGVLYHIANPLVALISVFNVSDDVVILEGIFNECVDPVLKLLPCPFGEDSSNIYSPSISFITTIANMYGFTISKIRWCSQRARAAILLRRSDHAVPKQYTICS